MKIALLYKTGGEYTQAHVTRIVAQIRGPGRATCPILLLTDDRHTPFPDVEVRHLRTNLPRWWGKVETCAPGIEGDLLFMDLDTTILGPLDDILAASALTIMRANIRKDRGRPFYAGYQSALMYLTEPARAAAWEHWQMQGGARCIRQQPKQSFDRFCETIPYWRQHMRFWQDAEPRRVAHYKKDIQRQHGGRVPEGTSLVVFCGKPRPWDLPEGTL